MIIIGRQEDTDTEETDTLQAFNEERKDLIVVTWDCVLDNVRKIRSKMTGRLSSAN